MTLEENLISFQSESLSGIPGSLLPYHLIGHSSFFNKQDGFYVTLIYECVQHIWILNFEDVKHSGILALGTLEDKDRQQNNLSR